MAFNARSLARLTTGFANDTGPANASHVFGYRTTDAAATVEAANYFLPAQKRLNKGSVIMAVMAVGGTPVLKTYVVTVSNPTTLTVALQATAGG